VAATGVQAAGRRRHGHRGWICGCWIEVEGSLKNIEKKMLMNFLEKCWIQHFL
jgi:hypothetical protein